MRSEERGLFEISYLAAGIFCNAECHLSAFPSPVFHQGRDEDCLSTGEQYKQQKQQLATKWNPVALTGARPHSL